MAENKPNTPDDKKTVPANEAEKNKNAATGKEPVTADGKAPNNKEPEKAAAQEAEKAEQDKKAETPADPTKAKAEAAIKDAEKIKNDEAVKKAQDLIKEDEKKVLNDKKKTVPPKVIPFTDKKAAEKSGSAKEKPPAKEEKKEPDGPSLKERKEKLEQELREKYGIPKSEKPVAPWIAPETEQVVRLPHEQLHAFKGHTFNVEKNTKFMAFVESIKAQGVTQPVIVRPDGKDKYEIISGHRRDLGGIEAGIPYSPCIIRALNDEQAIQQMVEDNVNNRDISTMELARSLAAQLDSIKRQGARDSMRIEEVHENTDENIGKRSNEIIAERNGMSIKQVQRHIALNKLTPALQEFVDGKLTADGKKVMQLGFTPAFELSYIKPENQNYIAVSIEGNQSTPSLSQVQRMRELDKTGVLNPDMIDGILMEQKKEVDKVIISAQELGQYFGKEKTPQEMKTVIMKALDELKKVQPLEFGKPEKKQDQSKEK